MADRKNRDYENSVRKVVDYIGNHYHEDLSLNRQAAIAN